MRITQESVGEFHGNAIYAYTMENDHGMKISCINYGCIITQIITPDRDGNFENVVVGYDSLDEYVTDSCYLGAVIGRVAGRIKGGTFEFDGKTYQLAKNSDGSHLHGGLRGFNQVLWNAESFEHEQAVCVRFSYFSPHGEEGYPGNLNISVAYTLNNNNELSIEYVGKSDEKTLLTMTNHSYFNLSGNLKRDILHHSLMIKSDKFLALSNELLPTGEMVAVKGTPFDFTTDRLLNTGAASEHPQNDLAGGGYDHPFVLNTHWDHEIVLKDMESGRTLTVETDEDAVVVYSGNQMKSGSEIGSVTLRKYLGVCLETQGFPDAIHHSHFPSWILEKDQEYKKKTTYKFGIF